MRDEFVGLLLVGLAQSVNLIGILPCLYEELSRITRPVSEADQRSPMARLRLTQNLRESVSKGFREKLRSLEITDVPLILFHRRIQTKTVRHFCRHVASHVREM